MMSYAMVVMVMMVIMINVFVGFGMCKYMCIYMYMTYYCY